jgi:arylsulfatase A-like enzyme
MTRLLRRPGTSPAVHLLLVAGALALPGCGAGPASGRAARAGEAAPRCARLLPGPLGEGVAWEIDSAWHRSPLPAARPEEGLEPALRSDFERAADPAAAGWLAHESFAQLLPAGAPGSPPAEVRAGRLLLEGAGSVAARIVPAAPLTPCVLSLRVRAPDAAARERRLFVIELSEDPSSLGSPLAIARRILDGGIVLGQIELGSDPAPGGSAGASRRERAQIGPRSADGFKTWRHELTTGWSTRALALVAMGSAAPGRPVELDDVALHLLPARALLGLPAGRLHSACFELPRPFENLDASLRATKVRCDWECRRALLLPRGASARCHFRLPSGGGALELGLAIVREERLTAGGPLRERAIVRVGSETREVELRLDADSPSGWLDLSFLLRDAARADEDAELEIRVAGEDSPEGPLVAASDPLLFSRRPDLPPALGAPPNLLFVSLDTLRADRLGRVVRGRSLTPRLDRLAAQCAVFSTALASSSYTLPSHVSMFTSQRPGEHGVLTVFDAFSPQRSPSLAEIAARHGYATAAFTSGGMLNAEFCGIDRGFDRFDEIDALLSPDDRLRRNAPLRGREGYNRRLAEMRRLDRSVLPWLAAHRGTPFVLFMHTYLVHNYQPEPQLLEELTRGLPPTPLRLSGPVPYRRFLSDAYLRTVALGDDRFAFSGEGPHEFEPARDLPWIEARYDATVAQADRDVGRLLDQLDALGLARSTIVVVTSDHGEELLEHGDLSHARTLFDEILRVPLLVRAPGMAPRVVQEPVELIDLAPTLLSLMGLPVDPRMRGADLAAEPFEPRDVTIHEGIEVQNARDAQGRPLTLRAARARSGKLILLTPMEPKRAPGFVNEAGLLERLRGLGYLGGGEAAGGFFDLRQDPGEQADLSARGSLSPAQASRMAELARRLLEAPRADGEGSR